MAEHSQANSRLPARKMDDVDRTEYLRTSVLAMVQLVPVVGGATGEIVSSFWKTKFEKKMHEVVQVFSEELERINASIPEIVARLNDSELAQATILEGMEAARSTTGTDQREALGRLLARGISGSDRQLSDARHLLKKWAELDEVEMILFAIVSGATANRKSARLDLDLLGSDYFQGHVEPGKSRHAEVILRDDFHIRRMERLLASGLIRRPPVANGREATQGFQLDKFWPSKIGEMLYTLISPAADDPE